MNNTSKPWYESKSVWIHGLTVCASLVTLIAANLPPTGKAAAYATGVMGFIGFALRLLTGTAIAGSPADPGAAS